jgi:hypothetical protein
MVRPEQIERYQRPKKVELVYICRDPSHDKWLVFENKTDAEAHEVETGHRPKLERLEYD